MAQSRSFQYGLVSKWMSVCMILDPSGFSRVLELAAWNSLPSDIRSCHTVHTFKQHLKTQLFTSILTWSHQRLCIRGLWDTIQILYRYYYQAASHYYIRRHDLLLPTEWRGLSVGLSVTVLSPAQMAELMKMLFGFRTWMCPRKHLLDVGPNLPTGRGNFEERRDGPL